MKETKGAKLLYNRVKKMLNKVDGLVASLEQKEKEIAEFRTSEGRTEAEQELERQLRQKRETLNKEEEEKPYEGRHCIWYIRGDKLFKTDKKPNMRVRTAHKRGQRYTHWTGKRLLKQLQSTEVKYNYFVQITQT